MSSYKAVAGGRAGGGGKWSVTGDEKDASHILLNTSKEPSKMF
jgi:hypothetical protein